jgi:hypothetical protein
MSVVVSKQPKTKTCCPDGSIGQCSAEQAGQEGELKGSVIELENEKHGKVKMYVTGTPTDAEGKAKPVVMVIHDIFGFDSARTHHMCDYFAHLG